MKPDDIEPPAKEAPTKGSLADAAQRTPLMDAVEQIGRLSAMHEALESAKTEHCGAQDRLRAMEDIYYSAIEPMALEALTREPLTHVDVLRLTLLASDYVDAAPVGLEGPEHADIRRLLHAIEIALENISVFLADNMPAIESSLPSIPLHSLKFNRLVVSERRKAREAVS